MHTQAQVCGTDWNFVFDVDAARGTRIRVTLLDAYDDGGTVIVAGHFAGSVFGRVLPATSNHRWASSP